MDVTSLLLKQVELLERENAVLREQLRRADEGREHMAKFLAHVVEKQRRQEEAPGPKPPTIADKICNVCRTFADSVDHTKMCRSCQAK